MTCLPSNPNNMGRPAHDRMKIVNDFVNWARTNPDAWTVPQFATSIGINSLMMNKWAAQEGEDSDFTTAFIQGKELLGMNRLNASILKPGQEKPTMDRGIYLRGLGNFDRDQSTYEREERKFDIECKAKTDKESNVTANADIVDRLDKTLDQISSLQESVRNNAEININKEQKS